MIRLVVHGAAGRMGQRIITLADRDDRFQVVAALGRSSTSSTAAEEHEFSPGEVDAVIDFSSDEGACAATAIAARTGAALLVGTTGLSPQTVDAIEESARSCPVMIAPNTSRGVAVLNHLVSEAIRCLGGSFEIDLVEQHHRHKRDAPSGTARRLLETIETASGRPLSPDRVFCVRAGDIVGDHDVQLTADGERLRLGHSATSRDVFAAGALTAAAWLAGRDPGRYTIEQSLGLA